MTHSLSPSPELRERLSAYLDSDLTAAETAALEAELATDPAARVYLNDLKLLSNELGVDEDDRRAADAIRAELRRRLGRRARGRSGGLRRWAWPAVAAALAVVALATLGGPHPGTGPAPRPDGSVPLEAVVQQYTLALDALGKGRP